MIILICNKTMNRYHPNDLDPVVGARIRAIRRERSFSQANLANRCARTQTTISLFESGRRSPKLSDLRAIAQVLGTELKELIGNV